MAIILQEALRGLFYAPFYVALARDAFAAEGRGDPLHQLAASAGCRAARDGRHGRCLLGRADAGHGDLSQDARLRHRLLRRGGDARSLPADGPRAQPGLHPCRPQVGDARDGERGADAVALPAARPAPGRHRSRRHHARDRPDDGAQRGGAEGGRGRRHPGVRALPQPAAGRQGAAHVWYEAARRGPTSYTTFYARRGTLAARRDELRRMVRAIDRTEKWVARPPAPRSPARSRGYFTDLPPAILEAACTRYKALGIWSDDADPAARRLRPAARRPGVGRLRLAGRAPSRRPSTTRWPRT